MWIWIWIFDVFMQLRTTTLNFTVYEDIYYIHIRKSRLCNRRVNKLVRVGLDIHTVNREFVTKRLLTIFA